MTTQNFCHGEIYHGINSCFYGCLSVSHRVSPPKSIIIILIIIIIIIIIIYFEIGPRI